MNKLFLFISLFLLYNVSSNSDLYQLNQIKFLINKFKNFTKLLNQKHLHHH